MLLQPVTTAPFSSAARSMRGGQQPGVGYRLAVDPEPGHPAVGNMVSRTCVARCPGFNLELVPGVTSHRAARHQRRPVGLGQVGREGQPPLRSASTDTSGG